ncbi:MAG: hypothetical protein ABSF98_20050 [Bryobacteraceae bacterium]|jgi:hypothetical protein
MTHTQGWLAFLSGGILIVTLLGALSVFEERDEAERMRNPAYAAKKRAEEAERELRAREAREREAEAEREAAARSERERRDAAERAEGERREAEARAERERIEATARADPQQKLSIESFVWRRRPEGVILLADFTLRNENDFPVSDVAIRCKLYDGDWNEIDDAAATLGATVQTHSSRDFTDVQMGLFPEGRVRVRCQVLSAVAR